MTKRPRLLVALLSSSLTMSGAACKPDVESDKPAGASADNYAKYEAAAKDIRQGLESVVARTASLPDKLARAQSKELAALLTAQKADLDALDQATERLDSADRALRTTPTPPTDSKTSRLQQPLLVFLAGAVVFVLGIRSYVKSLREKSDKMDKLRLDRDKAADDVDGNTDPTALDRLKNSQQQMKDTGAEVIQEVGNKIVTDVAFSLVKPTTVGGVLIKEVASQGTGKVLDVLTATKICDSNADASGCRIAATRSDAGGRATTPTGDLVISLSGSGMKRVVVGDVHVEAGGAAPSGAAAPAAGNDAPQERPGDASNNGDAGVDGPAGKPDSGDARLDAGPDTKPDVPVCPKYTPVAGFCPGENGCPTGGSACACSGPYCCITGFCWTRYIAACTQEKCPAGAGRDYTNHCKCPAGTAAVYDPCRPGFVVSCAAAKP